MLAMTKAQKEDSFEIISLKFNEGLSFDEQKEKMEALTPIIKDFKGLKGRDYFYSEENGRWIDFLIWDNLENAKAASDALMKIDAALAVFGSIDNKSLIFSHYKAI